MEVIHHGGRSGVTGSCHQLVVTPSQSMLVDCGLFQGKDARDRSDEQIDFSLETVSGLVLTHVHLDHVGRVPYLLASGFKQPIYCSIPSAKLLPVVLEDAVRVGVTRDRGLIKRFIQELRRLIRPVAYNRWIELENGLRMRLSPAGHILGSAIVEFDHRDERVVFSGDLGTRGQPLMNPPISPERADLLVLESTYGNRLHERRESRIEKLERVLSHTLENKGVTIIPAFSIGRTQELLYELNSILEGVGHRTKSSLLKAVDVIVDSPLALRFNDLYEELKDFWGDEAHHVLSFDEQPLVFENLVNIESHAEHRDTIAYLRDSHLPAIVIAASGMCAGGRVVSYLKEFISDPITDIVFVGYQAEDTPGRQIQDSDWVELDGDRYEVKASKHVLSGYSAHADQADLLEFVSGMPQSPQRIRLVHGEPEAQRVLAEELRSRGYHAE